MDRFFRVVKSNVNNVLSNLEDPEKVLEQAVADMQTDLVKIRQAYAEISATHKRMEKQKEAADKMAVDWYKIVRQQSAAGVETKGFEDKSDLLAKHGKCRNKRRELHTHIGTEEGSQKLKILKRSSSYS